MRRSENWESCRQSGLVASNSYKLYSTKLANSFFPLTETIREKNRLHFLLPSPSSPSQLPEGREHT